MWAHILSGPCTCTCIWSRPARPAGKRSPQATAASNLSTAMQAPYLHEHGHGAAQRAQREEDGHANRQLQD